MSENTIKVEALKLLREPFPAAQIAKLPKHGAMLDFVGHGYVTARLLDADPEWSWRPMAFDERGLPAFDEHGGLWIYLTVGGVERIGYGDSNGKKGPNAIKEAIGDALRNSGMRFGVALDLWCKGDPDAPQPPSPAVIARQELAAFCDRHGLDRVQVGERFHAEHGYLIASADADTLRAFQASLQEPADKSGQEETFDA